jgi:hypothetical protein
MAKRTTTSRRTPRSSRDHVATESSPVKGADNPPGVETTGRFIVIFKDDVVKETAVVPAMLKRVAGIRHVIASAEYETGGVAAEDLARGDAIHFHKLGIAVVAKEQAIHELAAAASSENSPIAAIEPEYVAYPSVAPDSGLALEYLRGYRDAVNQVYDKLSNREVAGAWSAPLRVDR